MIILVPPLYSAFADATQFPQLDALNLPTSHWGEKVRIWTEARVGSVGWLLTNQSTLLFC